MRKPLILSAMMFLLLAGSGMAQNDDNGVPDTVDLIFTVTPDYTTGLDQVQVEMWVFNDSNGIKGATIGYIWDNPNMQADMAIKEDLIKDAFDGGLNPWDVSRTNTNITQRFALSGWVQEDTLGVPPAPYRRLWCTWHFTVSDWQIGDEINIDTTSWGSIQYQFVGRHPTDGYDISYKPVWTGAIHFHDTAYVPPINLEIIPDSLHFEAEVGGSNPLGQNFQITTDGESVDFDVNDDIPWATVNPIVGSTPQTGLVTVNIEGLDDGYYVDSFEVVAPDADNSPQWCVVTLEVIEPPPSIGVDPSEFYFNAVAGEANPDPKYLDITNEGGGTLNWSVSNNESWLSLAPGSGTDAGTVTLDVDITGLPYDDYYDTIIVTDPAADNDPVLVPVNLSVGSDLPILDVTPAWNPVVVEVGATSIDPVTINIGNAGAGAMNFWFEEDSPRIVSFTPATGAAPQDVVVDFDPAGGLHGEDFTDTAWVHSNEAINSPFPVVFWFHFVNDPAELTVLVDTLTLTVYECSMGFGVPLPQRQFLAYNSGGDNPVDVYLEYDSTDFFTVNLEYSILPETFIISANRVDLPVGTYLDTIWVHAPTAAGSPHMLIVKYVMSEASESPEIYLTKHQAIIITQENSGPSPKATFDIFNANGGCMDFDIVEDIPWAFLEDQDGTAPAAIDFRVNSSGFPLGTYIDTFWVYAAEATNSPQTVEVVMHVFRYYGDVDWNGTIDIADLVYLALYMFQDGPEPVPDRIVGSMDCNPVVNIIDIVWLAEYMFQDGPKPCGNP